MTNILGTGMFIGSGVTLLAEGPGALLIGYIVMSLILFFVMNILGEMTTFLPVPGNGPQSFVSNYVDDSLGFAIGYNYWYAFVILVATEVTAAGIIVEYWITSINVALWISIFLVIILVLNMSPVRFYGESEFWFASIKIILLVGLFILGIVLFFGGGPNHDRLGFRYWKHGNAFKEHLVDGSTGRFLGVWSAVIKAGFAFICSPESVSIAAAESAKPRKNIPKACDRFKYRLGFFYVCATLIMGVICNSNDKCLLGAAANASGSPFVIGIQNAGIHVLNHIINAAILTSAVSSGNSFFYSASRTLYAMAVRGQAPRCLANVNKYGVPYNSVLISWGIACISYLNCSDSSAKVFNWFTNICTISGFISWMAICLAYIRWNKAIAYHGLTDRVTYRTILQPYVTYFILFFVAIISLTNGYAVFFNFNASDFIAAYISLPIVFFLYAGHKIFLYTTGKGFTLGKQLKDIDLTTGLLQIEIEDEQSTVPIPKNIFEKIWFWIA